jgi:hypothetical protein
MKTLYQSYLILISTIAFTGAAYGQQPPDLVISDSLANTAMGTNALLNVDLDESGCHNTASGENALYSDTSGSYNTATGFSSLFSNTTGNNNTAAGYNSLYSNSAGNNNTAAGYNSMYSNSAGNNNTADGFNALYFNSTGSNNTAGGTDALFSNTTGAGNTAAGYEALYSNSAGTYNTASGDGALYHNTTGQQNSASGVYALHNNRAGNTNTATGVDALYANTSGSSNIAQGYKAGYNLTTGNYNVDIGNLGVAAESGVIRIGTAAQQTQTFIAGINNSTVTGAGVVVDPVTGQLGVLASSERYKMAIAPMGSATAKLQELRPVTFHLKIDPNGALQYGLIAEEVAKIYPDLVIRNASGRIDGVRYDELAPMLLNELQQQQSKIAVQSETIATQGTQMRDMQERLTALEGLNRATLLELRNLQAKGEFVVKR